MKNFTLLISALLLVFFIAEAQTQVKPQKSKTGFIKQKPGKVVTKQDAGYNPDGYCTASGGCDEYITQVELGNINNSTFCNEYSYNDFTSADIPLNWQDIITVTNGNPYYLDECGIWVDWNRDEDFDDAGENISVSSSPGIGPYSAIISPPAGTTLGTCRIRIRITYNQPPLPCGIDQYGEVEDYLINVTPEIPNEWTGDANNADWHEGGNWLFEHVPSYCEDVVITTAGQYSPIIYGSDAECNNLTINAGAVLEIYDKQLTVHGNMAISGQLSMSNANGAIECQGNVDWNNNSTANFTASAMFNVYGYWFFNSGADVQIDDGWVAFRGSGVSEVKSKSPSCSFHGIYINKTSEAVRIISDANSPLIANGDINIQPNSQFINESTQNIYCGGDFYNGGYFDFSSAGNNTSFIFNGTNQSITNDNTFNFFDNVEISPGGYVNLFSGDIFVDGNLTISSGVLYAQGQTIYLGGDWNNTVGTSAFDEGTGRVVFQGNAIQNCSDETFNILDLNNSLGALYVNNTNVECASYDWAAGTIDVFNGGTFTANDLVDDGIYGKYVLSDASSTINLSNYDGFVDLDGEIHINNGTMNVYGGTTPSYWPYAADATIYMGGGVLDFHDQGIYIFNTPTYSLTYTFINGIVRTVGGFQSDRYNFAPTFGTFEFYGSGDYSLSQSNGCTLYNVIINKSAKEGSTGSTGTPIIDQRSGKVLSDGGKSNIITLDSDFEIKNDLIITSGELKLNTHYLNVYNDCDVYGTLTMDNSADVLSVGQESYDHLYFASGSIGNIAIGTINIYGWITTDAGCSFSPTIDNTVVFVGESGGGFSNYEPGVAYGKIEIAKDVGCTAYINSGSTQPIVINGNFSINNGQFNLNGMELSFYGSFMDINNHGTLFVDDNATLSLDDDIFLIVHTGGEIKLIGSAGNEATVTHASTGSYNFDIYGGTIAAQYAIFDYTNLSGVVVDQGSIVDPSYSFNYCKFRNGSGGSGSNYLTLNGSNDFIATGVDFDNSSGDVSYNVSKEYPTGHVTFIDATGFFAGPAYEYDPHDLVDWTGFTPGLWTGLVSTDWFTPKNWHDNHVPDMNISVIIPGNTTFNPVITSSARCNNLTIKDGASLDAEDDLSITSDMTVDTGGLFNAGSANVDISNYLTINSGGQFNAGSANVHIGEDFDINEGATLNVDNSSLLADYIYVSGELIMNNTSGIVNTRTIYWNPGSTANSDAGEIYAEDWTFSDGINVNFGTGNTVYVSNSITSNDADASFGNLVCKDNLFGNFSSYSSGNFPVRISGNCTIEGDWITGNNWIINGQLTVPISGKFDVSNKVICNQKLDMSGFIYLSSDTLLVHGVFNGGDLSINDGTFICDYTLPSGFLTTGFYEMTSGTFEIPNSNLHLHSGCMGGGTIRVGRSFKATAGDWFQPIGGTVEVNTNNTTSYSGEITCDNGNYFNNLTIDNGSSNPVSLSSDIEVRSNLVINGSTLQTGSNVLDVKGKADLNNAATLFVQDGGTFKIGQNP